MRLTTIVLAGIAATTALAGSAMAQPGTHLSGSAALERHLLSSSTATRTPSGGPSNRSSSARPHEQRAAALSQPSWKRSTGAKRTSAAT